MITSSKTIENFNNTFTNPIINTKQQPKYETFPLKKLILNNKTAKQIQILLLFSFLVAFTQNSNLKAQIKNLMVNESKQSENSRLLQQSPQTYQQQSQANTNALAPKQDSYTFLQNFYEDYPQVGVYSLKVNNTNIINNFEFTTQTKFDFYEEQRKNKFSIDIQYNLLKFLGSFHTNDLSQLSKDQDYLNYIKNFYKKRTILIGIDGMVSSCIDYNNLSAFKFLKENGSMSLRSRSTAEGLSGPGWSSVLCSLSSKDTGIVNNEWKAPWLSVESKRNYKYFTPINGLDASFPCVFDQLKAKKKAEITSSSKGNSSSNNNSTISQNFTNFVYSSWSFFRENLGNKAFPGSLDLYAECQIRTNQSYFEYIKCDDYSLDRSKNFVLQDFDFYYWYMGSLDVAGHTFSFCSTEYQSRVQNINNNLLNFIEFLKALGLLDKINIIITSDHGADRSMMNHGQDKFDGNLLVPLFMMGPDFKKNYLIKGNVNGIDIAPTIMRLHGLPPNELWSGKVVNEALDYIMSENPNEVIFISSQPISTLSAGFIKVCDKSNVWGLFYLIISYFFVIVF